MNPLTSTVQGLVNGFAWGGRTSRGEYWGFVLTSLLVLGAGGLALTWPAIPAMATALSDGASFEAIAAEGRLAAAGSPAMTMIEPLAQQSRTLFQTVVIGVVLLVFYWLFALAAATARRVQDTGRSAVWLAGPISLVFAGENVSGSAAAWAEPVALGLGFAALLLTSMTAVYLASAGEPWENEHGEAPEGTALPPEPLPPQPVPEPETADLRPVRALHH
ncbi:DUF805 domain-containing protein [Jannaschia aquimarina]|uniref:DUF805 domain-containing protein n=1 Tax=Jannaschia aquimarina TaxID=935700 RepID=A0A0D1EE51_9RHOB|nr:DUF805 domain-containing protein [Jannaschia aquimarina]KIT15969.1 hypothetical protein jaqu_22390 [Jannaschia aquimarina]SNS98941.1 Protein of unknown function [Jannaschia aquimarina]